MSTISASSASSAEHAIARWDVYVDAKTMRIFATAPSGETSAVLALEKESDAVLYVHSEYPLSGKREYHGKELADDSFAPATASLFDAFIRDTAPPSAGIEPKGDPGGGPCAYKEEEHCYFVVRYCKVTWPDCHVDDWHVCGSCISWGW